MGIVRRVVYQTRAWASVRPALAGRCGRREHVEEIGLDLRGLKCPLPAMKTERALADLCAGQILAVACTDPLATIDIPNLVRETGDQLLGTSRAGDAITFRIEKR